MAVNSKAARIGAGATQLWRANRPRGTAEGVYGKLKTRILRLDLTPGQSLSEPELALQYGVSRTPIREALIRLADEGLVDIVPKSGTMVARIVLALLPEAILVRKALEDVTTRHAAEKATGSDLLRLEACVLRQEEIASTADFEGFHLADEAFHAELSRLSGHPSVWGLIEGVKAQLERQQRVARRGDDRIEGFRFVMAMGKHGDAHGGPRDGCAALCRSGFQGVGVAHAAFGQRPSAAATMPPC